MNVHRFTRFWCLLGIAIVAVGGAAVGSAAVPEPSAGLKVDSTPNPGVYGNIIWGMSAAAKNDVWGVGVQATESSNNTLAIHWNGTSWSAVSTPNPAPDCEDGDILWGGQSLNGVAAVSPTDVWAVGSGCYSMQHADRALERHRLEHGREPEASDRRWRLVGHAVRRRSDFELERLGGRLAGCRWHPAARRALERNELVRWFRVPARVAGRATSPRSARAGRTTSGQLAGPIPTRIWSSTGTARTGASSRRRSPRVAAASIRSRRSRPRTPGRSGRSALRQAPR